MPTARILPSHEPLPWAFCLESSRHGGIFLAMGPKLPHRKHFRIARQRNSPDMLPRGGDTTGDGAWENRPPASSKREGRPCHG